MATCKYCKETIADTAIKCKVCGSSLTFLGGLVYTWIPIVSVLLALISWAQTFRVEQEKDILQEEKQLVVEDSHRIQANNYHLSAKLDSTQNKVFYYQDALSNVKMELIRLNQLSPNTPRFQENLERINNDVNNYTRPIDEQ